MSEKSNEMEAQFRGSGVSLTPVIQGRSFVKMSKYRIFKNIFVVSFGFLCLFTSFASLSNLQSSLNKDEGLGPNGLATLYGAFVLSCIFLPPVIIARLGCKWTVAFAMLCYILFMVANFYAIYGTIIPAAIILGIGAAPLWSAKCTYLTETGCWYAKQTGASEDDVINRFFGFFFMLFKTSQVWGNLISSMVFKTTDNTTITDEDLKTCGANFCPMDDTNLDKPPMEKHNVNVCVFRIYTVCGIYVGCTALAFLVIVFGLDPIILDREEETVATGRKFSMKLMLSTFNNLWRSRYQKLLVPLTMYSGIEQAFMTGDYTKSFVACALGIENIGFVMICYGVVDAVCSLTFGCLVQFVGHVPFFFLAFLVHGGLQVTFLFWEPIPDKVYMFYIFAALWGMGDAVIQTQFNALYGFLWTKDSEAAFANYRLWKSLGLIIAFGSQNYLCTDIKIYIAIGFLCVGMIGYAIVETMHRRNENASTKDVRL